MMKRLLCSVAALGLASCWQQASGPLEGQKQVLATVNGDAVTAYELRQSARNVLGPSAEAFMNEKVEREILESVIIGRAMAQDIRKTLTDEERARLEAELRHHEEQLLIKEYLKRHARTDALSDETLKRYYEQNLEKFGGRQVKKFELVECSKASVPALAQTQLKTLELVKKEKNWSAAVGKLKKNDIPLKMTSSESSPSALEGPLAQLLTQTAAGKISDVAEINGRYYLLRVLTERKIAAPPFEQVKEEVRRQLGPAKYRELVEDAKKKVLAQAKVVYLQKQQ